MEHLAYQRKVTIMAAVIGAMFFSAINQTIVGVALPRIIAQLGGMEYYTWITTVYLLTSTIATILAGKLSDIYGRKHFILGGIVIFMAGALLAGTAKDIICLILYRGIQGTGAGVIMTTAYTAIGDLFSPRERGRWSGLMSAVFGMSSVLGPSLGGYIVDHFAWHWIFWIFLPLGLAAFVMILILFPKPVCRDSQSIDYLGSFLLALTIVSMLLAFSWGGAKYPWNSAAILGLFAVTILALGLFLFTETKVKTPVLPLDLFKSSVVSISNAVSFLMNAGMMGTLMYMPFFVQGVMGISPTFAGYVTMPVSISMFTMSAFTGRRMTKTGKYKNLALAGMITMVAGMSLMIFMKSIPAAVVSMIVFGAGLGLGMPVFMIAVQNVVDSKNLGVATASVQLFRNLGGTIGIAVMGTVLSANIANQMKLPLAAGGLSGSFGLDPVSARSMAQLANPQVLLDHAKLESIRSGLSEQAMPVFSSLLESLKGALSLSLSNVFLTGALVLAAALVLTLFLKELPLRTTVHKESCPERENQPGAAVETPSA